MELKIGLIDISSSWSLGSPYNVGVAAAVVRIKWYSLGLMAPLNFKRLRSFEISQDYLNYYPYKLL